jgi:hypothetical protein
VGVLLNKLKLPGLWAIPKQNKEAKIFNRLLSRKYVFMIGLSVTDASGRSFNDFEFFFRTQTGVPCVEILEKHNHDWEQDRVHHLTMRARVFIMVPVV